jgi:hypothetical protein
MNWGKSVPKSGKYLSCKQCMISHRESEKYEKYFKIVEMFFILSEIYLS